MNLRGKKVVVIGGTSGFGLETAKEAYAEGASIVIASSSQRRVSDAVAQLPDGEGYVLDVSNETEMKAFFDHIGEFDHLVFTAGEPLQIGNLEDLDFQEARKFFEIRFWGAFTAAKYGSKNVRPGGSITLTNGIVAQRPWKGWTVASSIAGAVDALTRALAIELAPIRVNAVCPGVVRTDLWSGMPEQEREAMYTQMGGSLPVGRVGEVSDLAQAYMFLMREGFSTGQVIVVDGGAILV